MASLGSASPFAARGPCARVRGQPINIQFPLPTATTHSGSMPLGSCYALQRSARVPGTGISIALEFYKLLGPDYLGAGIVTTRTRSGSRSIAVWRKLGRSTSAPLRDPLVHLLRGSFSHGVRVRRA
jgi:hypothetical protein